MAYFSPCFRSDEVTERAFRSSYSCLGDEVKVLLNESESRRVLAGACQVELVKDG